MSPFARGSIRGFRDLRLECAEALRRLVELKLSFGGLSFGCGLRLGQRAAQRLDVALQCGALFGERRAGLVRGASSGLGFGKV